MQTTPQPQPRDDKERWAEVAQTLRDFDKRLLTLQQRTDHMAPAMHRSEGSGWEITKAGLSILATVMGLLTLVASAAVAWSTSQSALAQKVDERRFERDSASVVAEQRETRSAIQQLQFEQREFRVEALQRLREICLGVRTGCR